MKLRRIVSVTPRTALMFCVWWPMRLDLLIKQCRDDLVVAIGRAGRQACFDDAALLLGDELRSGSVYRLLAEHGDQLFGDDYFADLFARSRLGRPTVAARAAAALVRGCERARAGGGVVDRSAAGVGLHAAAGGGRDRVATQDTVTQLRAVIRKLLTAADAGGELELAAAMRAVLARPLMISTPPSVSRRAIGTTRRRRMRWSTPWCVTRTPPWRCCTAGS